MQITEVAIPVPLHNTFDYLCKEKVVIGSRVKVPFGSKKVTGIVLSHKDKSSFSKLKEVEEVIDHEALLSKEILEFLTWSANYYHHPIGEVLSNAIPKNLRNGKPALLKKPSEANVKVSSTDIQLTTEQSFAITEVLKSSSEFNGFLLHGVTGSGKTEVYLNITERLLKTGKQVLVLVPEIGLTPQMISRFKERIEGQVVAVHSQLNDTQKQDAYLLAKNGDAKVILGTRSAIFTPIPNLGLVIVDEEHDNSFKQQSNFRYSARDLSFMRAKFANVPLILGTATPSLETLKNVIEKKLALLTLTSRPGEAIMPSIDLIDMRSQPSEPLSKPLIARIKHYLSESRQVMLFINRRGYAPIYYCTECGWQSECTSCDSRLVYHRSINRLKCHHCGLEKSPESSCPSCSSQELKILGYGTERLEENLESFFPSTEVIRIDRDTTRKKKAFATHLKKINSGEPCIIIGTQMLAKGHDFSNLAFVGILDVDVGLMSTDFRATEHLAQLLVQVSGRCGRGKYKGEVNIQTRYPNHPIFNFVKDSRYTEYAKTLLLERKDTKLPPFAHQALICANAKNKILAENFLTEVAQLINSIEIESVEIWGPVPGVIERKSDYYYFNLYLQSEDRGQLRRLIQTFYQHVETIRVSSSVRWFVDIDPVE
ncbi:primosomal protein N' [Candidatus Thioglobus sp.]|nr:primosomal protein N' [Candidatus Thioglobus sp.]